VRIRRTTGDTLDARVERIASDVDLAMLKLSAPLDDQTVLTLGSLSEVRSGEDVVAIGSALGVLQSSVTRGIVSAVRRTESVTFIQTDAAINPGNSGGPLLDPSGKVIGINTAGAGQAQGINFAIPIDIAKPLLAQASSGQPLARPYLGIRFETIDLTVKQANGLPVDNGAWIPSASAASNQGGSGQGGGQPTAQDAVVPGGPADQAGLQAGDIITAVDGTALDASHALDLVMSQFAPGTSVKVDVLRGGQTIQLTVVLGTRPATT
jgi:S1-C subfamily serine protease